MNDRATVLVLGFHQTFEKNHQTGKMDRPVEWVTYAPIHAANSTRIVVPVSQLMPPNDLPRDKGGLKMNLMRQKWDQIEPAYKAWKEGNEIPVNGTPLGAWPGINNAQAQAFLAKGIRTVEAVATLPDSAARSISLPNVRDLVKQAQAFLEATDQNTVANRMTEMEKANADLKEQLEAAMALLEERTSTDEPKRGPGRPKKADVEAEAA